MQPITELFTGTAGSGDGNDTSAIHRHTTLTDWIYIQINGDLGGGTLTLYIDGTENADMLNEVALTGTTFTTTGAWEVKCPHGNRVRLKMASSTNPDFTAIAKSPQV